MKTYSTLILLFAFCCTCFWACKDTEETFPNPKSEQPSLPDLAYDYSSMNIPAGVIDQDLNDNTPQTNKLTDAGATLGRVLFYDKKLSLNNTVACGSCHFQKLAFSDNLPLSIGFEGRLTKRNSMPIANMRFNNSFFWDSQNISMEDQVLKPVENHIEMGMEDFGKLSNKLATVSYYSDLFTKAFGTPEINEDRISKAMAQFLRSMVSFDSKFDQGLDQEFANFTPLEKKGKEVFESSKAKCANCHMPNHNFTISWKGTSNIGLDMDYKDEGAGHGSFKVPSLRNIALTAPYMHDGRFATLEDVVNHYNEGIQNHPYLDWILQGQSGGAIKMNLTSLEKEALVAFLHTLTDESYINDPKFADPF